MLRSGSKLFGIGVFCLSLGSGANALARPTFPAALKSSYFPSSPLDPNQLCIYCHTNNSGGLRTVTRPFGMRLMDLGLSATSSPIQLVSIIDTISGSDMDVDSDGDGFDDIVELMGGSNPSDPDVFIEMNDDGTVTVIDESASDASGDSGGGGCAVAAPVPSGGLVALWGLGALSLALGLRRRRSSWYARVGRDSEIA